MSISQKSRKEGKTEGGQEIDIHTGVSVHTGAGSGRSVTRQKSKQQKNRYDKNKPKKIKIKNRLTELAGQDVTDKSDNVCI